VKHGACWVCSCRWRHAELRLSARCPCTWQRLGCMPRLWRVAGTLCLSAWAALYPHRVARCANGTLHARAHVKCEPVGVDVCSMCTSPVAGACQVNWTLEQACSLLSIPLHVECCFALSGLAQVQRMVHERNTTRVCVVEGRAWNQPLAHQPIQFMLLVLGRVCVQGGARSTCQQPVCFLRSCATVWAGHPALIGCPAAAVWHFDCLNAQPMIMGICWASPEWGGSRKGKTQLVAHDDGESLTTVLCIRWA
jgi:hypothetical protein